MGIMKYMNISLLAAIIVVSCSTPQEQSLNALVLSEKDLIPEGIAYSTSQHALYLTSIYKSKILKVDLSVGGESDFTEREEFGFRPGVGIEVDEAHDRLLALSSDIEVGKSGSSLFSFDLSTGDLKGEYRPDDTIKHFLNDLAISRAGPIYITDSENASVYVLATDGTMTLFLRSEEIKYPNGIAISPDNQLLYVASAVNGIRVIDIPSAEVLNGQDTTSATRGIDGLKFYNNKLFGLQNGFRTFSNHAFTEHTLSTDLRSIVKTKKIDTKNPQLSLPTTFTIGENGVAYVIGNSQLEKLNQDINEIINRDSLTHTRILKYALD